MIVIIGIGSYDMKYLSHAYPSFFGQNLGGARPPPPALKVDGVFDALMWLPAKAPEVSEEEEDDDLDDPVVAPGDSRKKKRVIIVNSDGEEEEEAQRPPKKKAKATSSAGPTVKVIDVDESDDEPTGGQSRRGPANTSRAHFHPPRAVTSNGNRRWDLAIDKWVKDSDELYHLRLKDHEWTLLEALGGILGIFTAVTLQMSRAGTPTLPWVIPMYERMLRELKSNHDDSNLPDALRVAVVAGLEKLETYYARALGCQFNIIATSHQCVLGFNFLLS
ncbi:hypothetical protein FB45DRAFT_1069775 [Roridomyces roridus]|uniref:Uncharacterized protein n=1 Tax=Roridomyces roridus TaxID=1738132 RepID=A0AAD7AZF0_9AGAR|nr:hypothetical protein FB45DRAFT_1069775 [Roridomyces roridus]